METIIDYMKCNPADPIAKSFRFLDHNKLKILTYTDIESVPSAVILLLSFTYCCIVRVSKLIVLTLWLVFDYEPKM